MRELFLAMIRPLSISEGACPSWSHCSTKHNGH